MTGSPKMFWLSI